MEDTEKSRAWAIAVNHVGYGPAAPKYCLALGVPPAREAVLQKLAPDVRWHDVARVPLEERPGGFFLGDFSSVREPADYRLVCSAGPAPEDLSLPRGFDGVATKPFVVREGAFDEAERLMLRFFTRQRCGSDKGWAGRCHQDEVPLRGTGRTVDLRGGYHQSCDLRCWADGVSASLYALARWAVISPPVPADEAAEELRWGADYFRKLVRGNGWALDSQFVPIGWGPREYYPAPLAAQSAIVSLLARASAFFRASDPDWAADALALALRVFGAAERDPRFNRPYEPPVPGLPAGSQGADFYFQGFHGSAGCEAGLACAALELWRAGAGPAMRDAALAHGRAFAALQFAEGPLRGRFRLAPGSDDVGLCDCDYGRLASGVRTLVEFAREGLPGPWRDAARLLAGSLLDESDAAGGTGLPGWRRPDGSPRHCTAPTTAASLALYLSDCADLSSDAAFARRCRETARRSLDWTFGLNPANRSFVEGVGHDQWPRPVFGQFFPSTPQLPGAVLHAAGGEYDLPAVGMTLWAVRALSRRGT